MRGILPPIILSSQDYLRLGYLVADALRDRHPVGSFLMSEVERAYVCDDTEVPSDIVRLNDWVTFRVGDDPQQERKLLLCPNDFSNQRMHLSVLSLWGAALVGLRTGDQMKFNDYEGQLTQVTVVHVGALPGKQGLLSSRGRTISIDH